MSNIHENKNNENYILKVLIEISNIINRYNIYLITLSVAAMTTIVFTQVFMRFVLNNSLSWAEEISRFLMIWMCFLGSGVASKEGEHIAVNIIFKALPTKIKPYVIFFTKIFILFFLGFCVWRGISMVQFVIRQKAPASQISMAWAYGAVPVGCAIMFYHIFVSLFNCKKDTQGESIS